MGKIDSLEERLIVVRFLRAARRFYKLSYLSEKSGIDKSLLSRYSSGSMMPSPLQASRLMSALRKVVDPGHLLMEEALGPNNIIDLSFPLMNKYLLELASIELYWRLKDAHVDTILVPETSGVVLATKLGHYLDANVVVARKRKTNPQTQWVEAHVSAPPNINRSLYIPKFSLNKGENVAIVDDFIRSGYTLSCAEQLVEKAGGKLVGVASLVVFGDEWRKRVRIDRVEALVRIEI